MEGTWTLDGGRPITYRVEVDGTPMTVTLMPDGTLSMEGRTFRLDVSEIQGLSLYSLLVNEASYEVLVDERGGTYYALVRGKAHRIQVRDDLPQHALGRAPAAEGEAVVRAPLCGLVVDIPVCEGDRVEENQLVAILESMKMENEIRAPRPGTVRAIRAKAGAIVREGDPLLTIG